jgi:circadian clock protein KaiC
MAYEELPRVKTGIQGLDKALNGGFPAGNIILISGGAGTGKSTFALQYVINGALLFGERGLYITTEQTKEELYRQASCFKWPLLELEQRNMLKIVYLDVMQGDSFLEKLDALVMSFEPKRIVIDSLTTLTDALIVSGISEDKGFSMVQIAETVSPIPRTDKIMTKSILYRLFKEIKKFKVTSLLTSELPEDEKSLSADGVSEFVADGVILLKSMTVGDSSSRNLELKKMRYTPIDGGLKSYDITPSGITLE